MYLKYVFQLLVFQLLHNTGRMQSVIFFISLAVKDYKCV